MPKGAAKEIDALVADGGDPGPFAGYRWASRSSAGRGFPDTHASVMYKDRGQQWTARRLRTAVPVQ
jgi:hypothetical protein